jgi:TolA-binding protein
MMLQNPTPMPDDLVGRLVDIAREATAGPLDPREQAGIYRLERALLRNTPTPRRSKVHFAWLLLPAAVGAVAGVFVMRERAITFEVVRARAGDGGYVSSGSPDGAVRFSDHSDLGLEPGTSLRISHLEVRGAHVMLEGGTLHVRIHTRPRGNWTLNAGPYIVHVTGTEFDLGWRAERQTLDLRLHSGSVTVEGPMAEDGVRVAAGQHLVADGATLSLVDELNATTTATTSAPAPTTAAENPPAPTSAAALPAPSRTPARGSRNLAATANPRPEEEGWGARVARGDFEGVLENAERRGMDKAMAESSAVDLAALADAARYARRQEVARRALMTERVRYPDSVQARDAPFFLGGLSEAQNSNASLDWYDVYLRESPTGAYASQALGRKMMLVHRLRGIDGARPLATEYLARFPDGPYAPSARKLLQAQ